MGDDYDDGGVNLSEIMAGSDATPPYTDNSSGAPDLQVGTPGQNWGGWITGGIAKAVDYAILRDQQNMQLKNPNVNFGYDPRRGAVNIQQKGALAGLGKINDRTLMMAGAGLILFLVLRGR